MNRHIMKNYAHLLMMVSLLLVMVGCGLLEFFGKRDETNPTDPCVDLIPTVTPVPIPTFVPPTATPPPGKTPVPMVTATPPPLTPTPPTLTPTPGPCSGPGQVLICDGKTKDNAKFEVLEEPTPEPEITVTPVYGMILYAADGTYIGNQGGRSGMDSICDSTSSKPSGFSDSVAFISLSGGDSISSMPSNYGVPSTNVAIVSISSKLIATDWSDLLDGTISQSLYQAGVLPDDNYWWSGSDSAGGDADTCSGWTTGPVGTYGSSSYIDFPWIYNDPTSPNCTDDKFVLCLAYDGPKPIILYDANPGGTYDGDLETAGGGTDGRDGADNLCSASSNRPSGYSIYQAFLSVDGTGDELEDLGVPSNAPVKSKDGTLIATNWNNLLGGDNLINSFADAGIVGSSDFWWSGSNGDGTYSGSSCAGWEDNSSSPEYGTTGDPNTTTSPYWIDDESGDNCDTSKKLICIAYEGE